MAAATGRILLLNERNYATWKTQMEAILHKNRLLKMVRGEELTPEIELNSESSTRSQQDVTARQKAQQDHDDKDITSCEVWSYLQETFDRKSTRGKVEMYRKLLNTKMDENQSIAQYYIEFDKCISSLSEMDMNLDKDLLTTILLDGLPAKYKEIRAAFDTANDFPSLKVLRLRLLEVGDKPEHQDESALKVNKYFKNIKNNGNRNRPGAVISWESKKQRVVATSSAEAEYMALAKAAKESSYFGYLLEELGCKSQDPTII